MSCFFCSSLSTIFRSLCKWAINTVLFILLLRVVCCLCMMWKLCCWFIEVVFCKIWFLLVCLWWVLAVCTLLIEAVKFCWLFWTKLLLCCLLVVCLIIWSLCFWLCWEGIFLVLMCLWCLSLICFLILRIIRGRSNSRRVWVRCV